MKTTLNYFLFDYDGTLCHTHDTINRAIIETFKAYHLDVPAEEQRLQAIGSGSTIYQAIRAMHPMGKTLPIEQVNSMVNSYRAIYTDIDTQYTTLFGGAATLLSGLKAKGKIVAVLSNKGFQTVTKSLRSFDLEQYTDLLIADGSPVMKDLNMKPDPASYVSVIKKHFRIEADSEVLMTGDTYSDLLFAKNCGIKSCWASYGYGNQQACKSLNPDYQITSLKDFDKIVSL
ncbi:HAD family hydrolase [Pedobacter sp. V48]|uniref:HAD family hydrolase n=1 Tax=Pedobacter sp. V48 TaxID=509635 RepID=UPI0003E4E428|nr:HAD family hydrolase [Pedobacter sp. V48]ETZ23016.1 hypothetical protein N824_20485 [Pedobacter sp. V48]